jgi:DNA-binding transcriptional regulator YdaS (Cro superfamily)
MKKQQAIRLAGSANKLAHLLGIRHQSVIGWGDMVPPLRVYQLKEMRPEWFKPRAKVER